MDIGSIDTSTFYMINQGLRNQFLDVLMPFVTHLDNWIPLLVVILAIAAYRDWRKALYMALITGMAVALSDYFNSHIIKSLIARPRPCVALADVHLLVSLKHTWSFPSSHAANTACAGTCACLFYRDARIIATTFLAAMLIGFSRIYIGVHYPLDVLAGYTAGSFFAFALYFSIQVIKKTLKRRIEFQSSTLNDSA